MSGRGLMVSSESRFADVLLVRVEPVDAHTVHVDFVAGRAAWFSPDSPGAGADGWVRDITDITADAILHYHDADACARDTALLEQWCRDDVRLKAASLLDEQATVFIDPANKRSVAVKMSQADLDQPPPPGE